MIRRADVDAADPMRPVNNTFQTITAAADAIATADHRFSRATPVQKRRWGSCCSIYWCFGSLKQRKRIGPAVLVPEPSHSSAEAHENLLLSPDNVLPFAAPPTSPVSFLQSERSSATQSPTAILPFTSLTANMYSDPDGPSSIFAIGPFAYETQLVSPPLNFSNLTTEPSTPPLTTTPSSPEVPFAHVLQPTLQNAESDNQYSFPNDDFQSYHFYPGSPISHLISPRSVISRSGASSPLPDLDFASSSGSQFSNFTLEVPPALLNLDTHSILNWRQGQGSDSFTKNSVGSMSGSGFVLNPQTLESMSDHHATNESQNIQILIDGSHKEEPAAANHRFSFELSDEDGLLRSVESKPLESNESQNIQILIDGSHKEEPTVANHRFSFELSDEDGLLRSVESKPLESNESQNIQILIDGSHKEEPAAANHRFSFELSDEDGLLRSVESKPLESNESKNIQIPTDGSQKEELAAANHRFSFELSDEDGLLRSVESKPLESNESKNIQILIDGSQKEDIAAANHRFSFELSDEDGLLRSIESKPLEPNESKNIHILIDGSQKEELAAANHRFSFELSDEDGLLRSVESKPLEPNESKNIQILIDGSQKEEPTAANHRFSFELSDEDGLLRSVESKPLESNVSKNIQILIDGSQKDIAAANHRFSFELSDEHGLLRSVESKPLEPNESKNIHILIDGSQKEELAAANHRFSFELSEDGLLRSVESKPLEPNESKNIQILIDGSQKEELAAANHRFSFELSDEDGLLRSVECKPQEPTEFAGASSPIHEPFETAKEDSPVGDHISNGTLEKEKAEGEEAKQHQEHHNHSITLGSVKEFNFDNGNGSDAFKPTINSDWWAKAKDAEKEGTATGTWSFFPMAQQ